MNVQERSKLSFAEMIWPIHRTELKLFVPMALIMFFMLFNFGALRSLKDSLVIPLIGAEAISFLKLWVVLPFAVLFTIFYVYLSNKFKFEHIFYIVLGIFSSFFLLFAYVIYPQRSYWHPSAQVIDDLALSLPHFKWLIKLFGQWSYALMYVFADLWSVVAVSLLFWQLANQFVDIQRAKRFYPAFGIIGNFGLILSGNILVDLSQVHKIPEVLVKCFANSCSHEMEVTLKLLVVLVAMFSVLAMIAVRYIYSCGGAAGPINTTTSSVDSTTTLSFTQSIKLIYSSKYVRYIALIVLCYNISVNILEGPWKDRVRYLYTTPQEYIAFMGKVHIWLGVVCMLFVVLSTNILKYCSWLVASHIPPLLIGSSGILFFVFVIVAGQITDSYTASLAAAVIAGAVQNILSKAVKYSLFDSTKEIAYIPLSMELRSKGKAAVEVVGSKLGKSLSAFIQSSTFMIIPGMTFEGLGLYLAIIFVLVLSGWFIGIRKLNVEYTKLASEN